MTWPGWGFDAAIAAEAAARNTAIASEATARGTAIAAEAVARDVAIAAHTSTVAKWDESTATGFTGLVVPVGWTVTPSVVVGSRSRLLRLTIVASTDDYALVAVPLAIPAVDAALLSRFEFCASMFRFEGHSFGFGLSNAGAAAACFAVAPMFYKALANTRGFRVTAGAVAASGSTPSGWGDANFATMFGTLLSGRKLEVRTTWNVGQPAGAPPTFSAVVRHSPTDSTQLGGGAMPYDDAGEVDLNGAFAAGWNGKVLSAPCMSFRSGGAGTYVIDLADIRTVKHPMDL